MSVLGFAVIPVIYKEGSLDPSTSKKKQPMQHYIYARAQQKTKNSKTSWPDGRTLFLVNVPPDATERELMMLLKPYGTVERVVFDLDGEKEEEEEEEESDDDEGTEEGTGVERVTVDQEDEEDDEGPRRKRRKVTKNQPPKVIPLPSKTRRKLRKTGQTVHVVFLDSSSLDRTLSIAPQKPRSWPTSDEPRGLAHYAALYDSLRPPLDAVREHADTYMELFEFEVAKTKQKSKYRKGEAIVDEDGFTLVTRGGAYGQTLGGGVAVATKRFQETGETSERQPGRLKKKKEKTNFYAFQKAEKQRNDLIELKKKWEQDKAKVEKLKASRHFKPY